VIFFYLQVLFLALELISRLASMDELLFQKFELVFQLASKLASLLAFLLASRFVSLID
jgi:hypothetical protein